jgi:predicted transcriptional regulator
MDADSATGPTSRAMLISIHPRHVANILTGEKTIELRRGRPAIGPGQEVLIYSTTPVRALTARCRIREVESLPPELIWRRYAPRLAVTRDQFDTYFDASDKATALHLCDVEALSRPVTLAELRATGPFHPPQTWHFLDAERVARWLRHSNEPLATTSEPTDGRDLEPPIWLLQRLLHNCKAVLGLGGGSNRGMPDAAGTDRLSSAREVRS